MGKASLNNCRVVVYCILLAGLLLAGPAFSMAEDTVCARVKIEIKQELTLERQGFDAHMRINNGLSNISLENVQVEVSFTDEDANAVLASSDPDHPEALFFIRPESMENITDVSGTGTVDPSSTADIHWLIIPATGASNGLESGTLYYVGAKLTYTLGGEQKVTEVTPDYIFVKPMPEITLDYFLPADVYGDDPLTDNVVEPIVPFSLGVRVKNNGHGVARKLKIDSAQPRITENKLGLLIGFAIEGSEVNGQPATDSLLVDFGDIAANSSGVARWIMTCSLSGKFVSFNADFSHSDELGGELTSLIQAANTHFLVHDVWVDLPGRDAVGDFLAKDGDAYRIYESEVTGSGDGQDQDPVVADQSDTADLTGSGHTRTLTTAVTAGFMYVRLSDPFGGQKVLKEVVRSDGKIIKTANAWLSHTRVKDNPWQYFVNLFDVNSTGRYTLKFEDASALPAPPVLQYIADKTVAEEEQISFIVEASDPNATVPRLSAAPLPVGADFIDQGNGRAVFDWTPEPGQAGVYDVIFTASDGVLSANRRATITVKGFRDTDGDDLDDDWELTHFGTLARDGSGDYDHDGISDRDEFLNDSDPAELADLAVRLTADHLNPPVGDELILTVTATNSGLRDATGVQVSDWLSAGLTHISDDSGGSYDPATGIWNIGDIPSAAPDNTAVLMITVAVIRPGKIINIAALTNADLYDPDRSNNSAGLILNGGLQSDLALAQTIDNPIPEVGDTVAVTIKVTNNGIDAATGVQIEDWLPAGLTYKNSTASQGDYDPDTGVWNVGDLSVAAGAALRLTLTVDTLDEIINTAIITHSDQPDPDPTNNRTSVVFNQNLVDHFALADLAVYKMVNQPAVNVGEPAAFTLLIRNNGPADAGNVEINDLLPAELVIQTAIPSQGSYDQVDKIWQAGTIAAGSYIMLDTVVDVTAAGEQNNTANIIGLDEFDPDDDNDSHTRSVTGLAADITVTVSSDRSTANIGENFIVTLTVLNQGPHDATGVQVVDQTPTGLNYQTHVASRGQFDAATGQWELGDLANGSSAALELTLQVGDAGEMINIATLTSFSPTDTDISNNSAQLALIGNAAPVIGQIPDQTVAEGAGFAVVKLDDYVDDANNAAQELTWASNGQVHLTVHIDEQNHTALIQVPHPDWNGSETTTFKVTDPYGLSDERGVLFRVTPVNDAPVNTVPAEQTTAEDLALIIVPAISIADVDAGLNAVEVALNASHGVMTLSSLADLTFVSGDGSRDAAMVLTGTLANINQALNGLRFDPDPDYFGPALIEIQTNDQGHSGDGGPRLDVDAVNIAITSVNDAPQAVLVDAGSSDEGQPITFSGNGTDIDSATLTYHWDFAYTGDFTADLSGVDLSAPQWTYHDDGIYTVALRVEDEDSGISEIVTAQVPISDLGPLAAFTKTAQSVSEGTIAVFSDTSTSYPDDIVDWLWNFGDGLAGTGRNPSHSYEDNGIYTVRLTVTDDDGSIGSVEDTITVTNVAPAVAAGSDQTVNEGDIVAFAGGFNDPGVVDTHTYAWDFGDGSSPISGTLTPTHIFKDNGVFTVTLTVADDDGGVGIDTLKVTVANAVPGVDAGDDLTAAEGDALNFAATFSDPGADTHSISWDFGDAGTTSDTLTPTHTYGDNGTYMVTVAVSDDDGGIGTDTLTVAVSNAAPIITGITTDSPSNAQIHVTAAFTDPGWLDTHAGTCDFGDGTTVAGDVSQEHDPPDAGGTVSCTHQYAIEGIHTVGVRVTDDDGAGDLQTTQVLIDKTPPVITVFEPKSGYYHNTQDLIIDFAVEDPVSNGVASGLAEEKLVVTLDGQNVGNDQLIDLSALADGQHAFRVQAFDQAGNTFEQEIIFEVGPVPAMFRINPRQWSLSWLDPFDEYNGRNFSGRYKHAGPLRADISLDTVAVETILPTGAAFRLVMGRAYGDFVVEAVEPAPSGRRRRAQRVRALTLRYEGSDEIDILAFSGERTWDFYGIRTGDSITIDAGEGDYLSRHTVLSTYTSDAPFYSAADILPETIRLNGTVPIIAGSARLIIKEPFGFGQLRSVAEAPVVIDKQGRHYVWLSNLGDPQRITLEVGDQIIFEDKRFPLAWHDRFRLEEDGPIQRVGLYASRHQDILRVFHHNLAGQARIYLDGRLALSIAPDEKLVTLRVRFNRFDAISSLDRQDLARGGDWQVTPFGGVRLLSKYSGRHITLDNLGKPDRVKLMIGDTVVFEDASLPLRWSDHCLIVDGQRQDMSIRSYSHWRKGAYLSIQCRKLTREARLYLDDELVLVIAPPPAVAITITGDLELDGDPATFDGGIRGSEEIKLKGRLPQNFDLTKDYQRINTSGEPALQIGDRFGEFEVVGLSEDYDDYRITELGMRFDGWRPEDVKVYKDYRRKHLIGSFRVAPGDLFTVDVDDLTCDRVYLKIGRKQHILDLQGRHAARVGDRYGSLTVDEATGIPQGPPHYIDLTLEYAGAEIPITVTAYDGGWQHVLGTYEVDPAIDPAFTIDGSQRRRGRIGANLVLEYGDDVIPGSDEPAPAGEDTKY